MTNLPFHYAFLVKDLESTRKFYCEILGCKEGRSTETWVDFDFFGNQLSAHISSEIPKPINCGHVDKITVPIPHFGSVIDWDKFQQIAERIKKNNIQFIIEPTLRYEGKPGEQMTMFLTDFSNNPIEFKSFKKSNEIFAS
ncbi:MAG: VOC family protein [Bacteroidetes bacterium]|nr:VOC family protein [Bacteroidota bacterium]